MRVFYLQQIVFTVQNLLLYSGCKLAIWMRGGHNMKIQRFFNEYNDCQKHTEKEMIQLLDSVKVSLAIIIN